MCSSDLLVRPGVRAWHPDGVTPVTVEYSERHKVQVRHDDGRVEILDRHALVAANGWATTGQAAQAQTARRTHVASPEAKTNAGIPEGGIVAMHALNGRVLVQHENGAMRWVSEAEAAELRPNGESHGVAAAPATRHTPTETHA